ncbi:SDR family NAD(P)-dependent oxidoreductase [Mesorhizobium sp. A623]
MSEKQFPEGVAVVSGGSGAIGGAICLALARAGTPVVTTFRSNRGAADKVVEAITGSGGIAHAECVDLSDSRRVASFADGILDRFKTVHSVVYASGPKIPLAYINALTPEAWAGTFSADVNGCFNLFSAFLPHLKTRRGGSFLAVTTCAVERVPQRDILSAAPKAAIETLVRGLAKEEGRYGIRANCVAPGLLEEGIGRDFIEEGLTPELVDRFRKSVPMKRFTRSEEVAEAALFLLSNRANFITGQSLAVDGGLQL